MSNEVKFKVGDWVVRADEINHFKYGVEPLEIVEIDCAGYLKFKQDRPNSYGWSALFFERYQPEVEPMQPLVSIYDKALDLRFEHEILGDVSLREFFCTLLVKLWDDPCGFSGKRPWGNSDWDAPVYAALIKAGIITGEFDSDGYIEDCDYCTGSEFISKMITHAFGCSFNGN